MRADGAGEPDASGRRRSIPIAGSEFEIPLDVVIYRYGDFGESADSIDDTGLEDERARWRYGAPGESSPLGALRSQFKSSKFKVKRNNPKPRQRRRVRKP